MKHPPKKRKSVFIVFNNKLINYNNRQEFDFRATRLTPPEGECAGCIRHSPLGWFEASLNGTIHTAWFYGTCCQQCHVSAVWPCMHPGQPFGNLLQNELEAHTRWGRKRNGPKMKWYCPLCCFKYDWTNR